MDLVTYLGERKLNELIIPRGTATKVDISRGEHLNRGIGFLGQRVRLSEKQGLKLSNTTIGTLYSCEIQFVRIQPDFGTVNLADIVVGRPLFWNDTKKFFVTPLASITARLAGIAITNLTSANSKGDIIPIVTFGDVGILLAAAITKASVAINDPIVLSVASSLGSADILADATGWTNVQLAVRMGKIITAIGATGDATVQKCYLDAAQQIHVEGVM
jgi:hypothetical protein